MEAQIKEALIRLEKAITESDGDGILVATRDLDAMVARERGRLSPRLLHFLERRSYGKAREFLAAEEGA
ncbi:MAG: hypothetical protein EA425_03540 [Puniceicoccaceae bacterium]|nr:MAG: hypothetical protein EA425_03540 [Puniceicoccaceae bacterium]